MCNVASAKAQDELKRNEALRLDRADRKQQTISTDR